MRQQQRELDPVDYHIVKMANETIETDATISDPREAQRKLREKFNLDTYPSASTGVRLHELDLPDSF